MLEYLSEDGMSIEPRFLLGCVLHPVLHLSKGAKQEVATRKAGTVQSSPWSW